MANIFDNKIYRKVPKNLSECILTDEAAKELFSNAIGIESQAKISACIVAAIGIIVSIILAITTGKIDDSAPVGIFFIGVLITTILSYTVYYPQHFAALQMCSFATIVNNTSTCVNLQMYYFKKILKEDIIPPKPEIFWGCPVCGRKNPENATICKCGYDKNVSDEWICPKCNRKNKKNIDECECGYNKIVPNDDNCDDDYDDVFIEIICPNCDKNLEFRKGTISASCPYCGKEISISH